jgi:hypothetical protein
MAAFAPVAVPAMFSGATLTKSSFTTSAAPAASAPAKRASVTMAVDAFQRKFQSFGKINVDYSRPKKLASYKRSGGGNSGVLAYPSSASFAGHYSLTNCGKASGAKAILMKYDEYCAKGMVQTYKRSAVPTGVYTTKCTEATTPYGAAEGKRVFNRIQAFRQAQKPVNVRMAEKYAIRKACLIMANGCDREEKQFASMPMSAATFLAGKTEATGACFRNVLPTSTSEDYMASGIRAQLIAQKMPGGVYRTLFF